MASLGWLGLRIMIDSEGGGSMIIPNITNQSTQRKYSRGIESSTALL
jgi:hypothetical protein